MGNCYVNEKQWEAPFECEPESDPVHRDHLLGNSALDTDAFRNSGHDRGHIAPGQAFSWHVCGAYQTSTMANMSPQSASFNQGIWANLESQVLTRAIDHEPIHVVSGTIFRRIQHERFAVYQDGALDTDELYSPGSTLADIPVRMRANVDEHPSGHILRPRRSPNPYRLDDAGREVPVPTGYFKVIYRPATDEDEAQAIWLTDHYAGLEREEAFWAFVSTIDLIEDLSGISH